MPQHEAPLRRTVPVEISPKPSPRWREVAGHALIIASSKKREQELEHDLAAEQAAREADRETAVQAIRNMMHQYETDSDTGLANKEAFQKEFPHAAGRPRYGMPLALMVVDADGLKRLNEDKQRAGYEVGTHLLQVIADTIQANKRPFDKAYRIGGDEFVVLMPAFVNTPEEATEEKIAGAVAATTDRFNTILNQTIAADEQFPADLYVGASAGIVVLEPGETPEGFLHRATEAMGEQKQLHRAVLEAQGVVFGDDRLIQT